MGTDKIAEVTKAYEQDDKFKTYVDAYAQCRQISVELALKHEVVYQVLLARKQEVNKWQVSLGI